jgi:aspartate carbamoyltransferase catalytic subunit
MGAEVTIAGPPTLIPRGWSRSAATCATTSTTCATADVVYALRMQNERIDQPYLPSLREIRRTVPDQRPAAAPPPGLMHPGPVNRGVELSGEVVDSPQAVITAQVEGGVVVRMAVLNDLLEGAQAPDGGGARTRHEPQLA